MRILFDPLLPQVTAVRAEVHDLRRNPGEDPDAVALNDIMRCILAFPGSLSVLQELGDELAIRAIPVQAGAFGKIDEVQGAVRAEREVPRGFEDGFLAVVPDAQNLLELDDAARVLGQGPGRIVDAGLGGSGDRNAEQECWEEKESCEARVLAHLCHLCSHHRTREAGWQVGNGRRWMNCRCPPIMVGRTDMSSLRRLAALAAALFAAAVPLRRPVQGQEFDRGKLIEKIACRKAPEQTYALYLPSAFDPDKKWPVLFLFDPGARGATAVEAFREGAETYGWILAGSHGSRNGPLKDSAQAALAVWADVSTRLPIDERRVYATGFSGGARVASFFPRVIGRPIAGVIGCGAGLASGLGPAGLQAAAYFGLAGLADFNYGEMKGLDLAFDPSGVPHRFFYFEGTHDWPPSGYAARAVGWMEVAAINGVAAAGPDAGRGRGAAGTRGSRALEEEGRFYWAADKLEAAGRIAEALELDLPGLAGLAGRIEEIKAGKEYRRFLDAERKRDRRTIEFR